MNPSLGGEWGSAQELGDRPGSCRVSPLPMPDSSTELDPSPWSAISPQGVQQEPRREACSPVHFGV